MGLSMMPLRKIRSMSLAPVPDGSSLRLSSTCCMAKGRKKRNSEWVRGIPASTYFQHTRRTHNRTVTKKVPVAVKNNLNSEHEAKCLENKKDSVTIIRAWRARTISGLSINGPIH